MAELEALSNKELRQKCIEFGLPNVPVTDSSRKLLIRRLDAVISGKPVTPTPTKSNRRETVHGTKQSEVASSPKIPVTNNPTKQTAASNRPSRRTISVPERHVVTTTTVSEPEYSDVSPDRFEPEPVKAKPKTPEKQSTLYPKLPTKEPSPKPQQLSKTGVVTTSYVQETTINKIYATPDEIDLVVEEEPVKKVIHNPQKFSYVPVSEPKITTTVPLAASHSSGTRYSPLDAHNYNSPSYLTSTNVHKNYIPSTAYKTPLETRRYTQSYEPEIDDEADYEDDEDEVVLVEESPIKDAETPFLSEFARSLENLKATPLRQSVGPTSITPLQSTLRNREKIYSRRTVGNPMTIYPRRTLNTNKSYDDSAFHQFILAMEEKYHVKQCLVIISIFILAVFIYVFFIQSV